MSHKTYLQALKDALLAVGIASALTPPEALTEHRVLLDAFNRIEALPTMNEDEHADDGYWTYFGNPALTNGERNA